MKSTLIAMSCLVVGMVACTSSPARRIPGTAGTAGTGAPSAGTAGTGTPSAGTAGDQGTAGMASGTAGDQGTAGMATGTAGNQGTAGTGTGGTGGMAGSAAGTTGTGGVAGTQGTAGAAGTTAGAGGMAGSTQCTPGSMGGAGGGTGSACDNSMWTFTPNNICMNPPNAACGFCGNAMTGSCAPQNAIDGKTNTRYTSGETQAGMENFVLSFAAPVSVTGIKLDSTGFATDATTSYLVEYSLDGSTFQGWCPPVAGMGQGVTTDITFPNRISVKALRVSQTGMAADGTSWWSLSEVTLDGCQ